MNDLEILESAYEKVYSIAKDDSESNSNVYYFDGDEDANDYCFACANNISEDWQIESMPESDDLNYCCECGKPLNSLPLWTFDEQVREELQIQIDGLDADTFKNSQMCFTLSQILDKSAGTFEKEPELTIELAKKVISLN